MIQKTPVPGQWGKWNKETNISSNYCERLELDSFGNSGRPVQESYLKVISFQAWGSWGIYLPSLVSHWLRATPKKRGLIPQHFISKPSVSRKSPQAETFVQVMRMHACGRCQENMGRTLMASVASSLLAFLGNYWRMCSTRTMEWM